jgi:hypothetical protein
MSATHTTDSTRATAPVLYLAFELGWTSWKLAFPIGAGQKLRLRSIPARDLDTLLLEIRKAQHRFGLAEETPVISGYEASRDGFWLHRYLEHQGIENLVVDAASIEVNRRQRRAKSDNLDATKLVGMLIRWHLGETKLWGVVHVPMAADEDRRHLHRELIESKAQRTEHTNRIQSLLAGLGLSLVIDGELPRRLEGLRQWDGLGVPTGFRQRILRDFERWPLVGRQIHDLEAQRMRELRDHQTPPGGEDALASEPQGDRREQRVAAGAGVLRLPRDPQPSRAGEPGRPHADATAAGAVLKRLGQAAQIWVLVGCRDAVFHRPAALRHRPACRPI